MSDALPMLGYFEHLYRQSDDPYATRTRWYEARKRAVLLAALPRARYRQAYEPGCGSGELTLALAARCDALLASDFNDAALDVARARTAGLPQVRIERQALPQGWPTGRGRFDLIVLSELGYFLDAGPMDQLARHCAATLAPDGTLVACHWRPDFVQRRLSTDAVHDRLAAIGLHRLVRHDEDDFLLELWSADGRSVARQEGIG